MTNPDHRVPLTHFAEVNPAVAFAHLAHDALISFIPMSDASETGEWIGRQTRKLSHVRQGYTPFQEGDLLFAKITPCMENGKGCHARNLTNGIGFGSTEFHVLRARPQTDSRFIYHWLQSEALRRKAEALMTGSAGQRRVPAEFFHRFEVPVIPFGEQRRIAEILDTVDAAIRQTEALIAKLKQVKAGLLHDLLTRGLDEHGQLRGPAAHPEQFRVGPDRVTQFPASWQVRPLSEVATIGSGVTLGRDLGNGPGTIELPYLRVANVQDGFLDLAEIKTVRVLRSEVNRYLLQPGDVLMNEGGDFDKLGRGTVWRGQISPCLHQNHIFRVRTDACYLRPDFLAVVSGSIYGKRFFVLSSKQSTNLASINSTQLKSFPVPCPAIEEQDRILVVLGAQDERIQAEETYRDKLKQFKKGLMDDLLAGKVRVNQAVEVMR